MNGWPDHPWIIPSLNAGSTLSLAVPQSGIRSIARVYVSKCKVSVPGGIGCSLETAAAMCRDEVEPAVDIVDRDVIARDFVSGDLRYYVLANNYADRYYGLGFDYKNPEVNYEQGKMIQAHNRALAGSATFREKGRWLFDMSTGQPLGTSNQPRRCVLLRRRLRHAGGAVLPAARVAAVLRPAIRRAVRPDPPRGQTDRLPLVRADRAAA